MNGQRDEGEKRKKERMARKRGKNRNRQRRMGRQKAEKSSEPLGKSRRWREVSRWSKEFWVTTTQTRIEPTTWRSTKKRW